MTLSTILLAVTLFFTMSVDAQTNNQNNQCGKDCQWSISDTTLTITGTGKMQDYFSDKEIPWQSNKESITKIIINNMTSIGKKAFQNMPSLKQIQLNSVTTINEAAFYNTGLEEIEIPATVETIGKNAFENNLKLSKITFQGNSQLNLIEAKAFRNCPKLTEITLPESLVVLERKVFEGCSSLTKVIIGRNLQKLGEQLFTKCSSLSTVTINEENQFYSTLGNVIFNKNQTKLIYYPVSLKDKEYRVPFTVEIIGKESFIESKINSLILPSDLQIIEESAFYGNRYIKELVFPHYLEEIQTTAFAGCRSLEKVIIKSQLIIGEQAFIGCRKLGQVIYSPDGLPTCPNNVFEMTKTLDNVKVTSNYYRLSQQFCGEKAEEGLISGEISKDNEKDDVYYYIDPNGTLIIYGNGTMRDFTEEEPAPWNDQKDQIQHVMIKDGVENI